MTKNDTAKLLASIAVAYPNFKTDKERELTGLWYTMLKEFPKELVNKAVMHHIAISKFAPTVADIRELIYEQNSLIGHEFDELWKLIIETLKTVELHPLGNGYVYPRYKLLPQEAKELVSYEELSDLGNMDSRSRDFKKREYEKKFNSNREKEKQLFLTHEKPMELIPHYKAKELTNE